LKVLFDEDVPRKLTWFLSRHEIHISMRWGGIKNGALLKLVGREGFDVFLTGDKNRENQQQLEGRAFAILIMSAINWPVIRGRIQEISAAIDQAAPGTVKTIDCGAFVPRSRRMSE
jgi:hypothetical protein